MSQNLKFAMAISENASRDLIKKADFISVFFLLLVGRRPKDAEKVILNAILVSVLLETSQDHVSAISAAMNVFKSINENESDIEKASENLIDSYVADQKKIPGFGHPECGDFDSRAKQLFDLARKNDLNIHFMNIAKQLEHSLEDKLSYKVKKKLVLNIDGAIAALLLTMDINPIAGDSISHLVGVASSIVYVIEEQKLVGES